MAVVSWCLNLEKVRPIDTLWHVKEVVTARVWNIGQQGEIRKSSVSRLCHKRGVFCGPGRAHARPLRGFYVFWARMPCFFSFPTISSFLNCAKNAVGLVFSSLRQFAVFFLIQHSSCRCAGCLPISTLIVLSKGSRPYFHTSWRMCQIFFGRPGFVISNHPLRTRMGTVARPTQRISQLLMSPTARWQVSLNTNMRFDVCMRRVVVFQKT